MQFAIQKNTSDNWDIYPVDGPFKGFKVATAEAVDITSVVVEAGKIVGHVKAVWGLELDSKLDVFEHMETARALCLGRVFRGGASEKTGWGVEGLYDLGTGRAIKRCARLIILGSSLFRRGG